MKIQVRDGLRNTRKTNNNIDMEKKTKPSPVEQMREFLRMEVAHWHKVDTQMGIGRWRGAFNALSRLDELFPEVQQVPVEDKLSKEALDRFMRNHKPVEGVEELGDIDALAEKYTSEQIISDLEKRLYKCGLDNAKLIGKMTELKEQCLRNKEWSDKDLLEAWSNGMKVDESNSLNYEQWLAKYKKNKAFDKED